MAIKNNVVCYIFEQRWQAFNTLTPYLIIGELLACEPFLESVLIDCYFSIDANRISIHKAANIIYDQGMQYSTTNAQSNPPALLSRLCQPMSLNHIQPSI